MSKQPLRDTETPRIKHCLACGQEMNWFKEYRTQPMAKWKKRKYCSSKCSNSHRPRELKVKDIERVKDCKHCGREMSWYGEFRHKPMAQWKKMKFCSKQCADEGGFRYQGEEHPNYKPDARSRHRKGPTGKWVNAVHAKCDYICQDCGVNGIKEEVSLVAHHVKSFAEFPELRFDVDNGVSLCVPCHELIHYGKLDYPIDEDEIITKTTPTSMSRRVKVKCNYCDSNLYKAPSDLIHYPSRKRKKYSFCDKQCMGKHYSDNHYTKNPDLRHQIALKPN